MSRNTAGHLSRSTVMFRGRLRTIRGLAQEFKQREDSIYRRLKRGWTIEEAVTGKHEKAKSSND